jgi:hypothetical protein
MTTPGFTAETALTGARRTYRGVTRPQPSGRDLTPALLGAVPYVDVGALALDWGIYEPNCYLICLRGHCRWICY